MGTLRRFFKPSPARSALQTLLPSFTASVILQQDGNGKQLLANDEIARSFVARSLYDNKLGFDLETGYGMDFMDRHKAIYEKVRLKIIVRRCAGGSCMRKQRAGRRANRLSTMGPE